MSLCYGLESLVVVFPAPADLFNVVLTAVEVHHFVEHGVKRLLYGVVEHLCGYVQLIGFLLLPLLATQRPDANVVPGQIKNNLDIRVCGRADLVLSQIIMDNGSANDLPKDIPGRFITNLGGGTIFQGYMLPDLDNDDTGDNKEKNDTKDNGNKDDGTIMEGDVDGLPFDGGDSPDTHS